MAGRVGLAWCSGVVVLSCSSWAYATLPPLDCVNDVAVGDDLVVSAGGVAWMVGGDDLDSSTFSMRARVVLSRQSADGSYGPVDYELESRPPYGTWVEPVEPLSVGEVYRLETQMLEQVGDCGPDEGVMHEFKVVSSPTLVGFEGLSIEAPVIEDSVVYYDESYYEVERASRALTSRFGVNVVMPAELAGLGESLYVDLHFNGSTRVYSDPFDVWRSHVVRGGTYDWGIFGVCALEDESFDLSMAWLDRAGLDGTIQARVYVPGTDLEWWSETEDYTHDCPEELPWEATDGSAGGGADGLPEEEGTAEGGCAQSGWGAPVPFGWAFMLALVVGVGARSRRRRSATV